MGTGLSFHPSHLHDCHLESGEISLVSLYDISEYLWPKNECKVIGHFCEVKCKTFEKISLKLPMNGNSFSYERFCT